MGGLFKNNFKDSREVTELKTLSCTRKYYEAMAKNYSSGDLDGTERV